MSEHKVDIQWSRDGDFSHEGFSRKHDWKFEDGPEVCASAAPEYDGDAGCADPEQGLVAAISSCHMLTFLALAAKKRLIVESYTDAAVGHLENNEDGMMAVTRVDLYPKIEFGGDKIPDADTISGMHEKAHKHCFIANSVKSEIVVHAG